MTSKIKRVVGLLMVFTIMFTMGLGNNKVKAENVNGEITIKDTTKDQEYRLYKILDLTQKDGKVAYTISDSWKSFFENAGSEYLVNSNVENKLNSISINNEIKYLNITNDNVSKFAMKAFEYAKNRTDFEKVMGTGTDVKFNVGSNLGYYLVYPYGASEMLEGQTSIVSLTSTTPKADVIIKSRKPVIEKEADKVTVDLGDPINYTLKGKVPNTTGYTKYKYEIVDTLSNGLTLDKGSIKVFIDNIDVTSEVGKVTIDTSVEQKLKINFDMMKFQEKVGKDVKVTYQASLNENAIVGNQGNKNEVTLEYSNNPNENDDTEKTPPIINKVYTAKIKIIKVDGKNKEILLDGAKFVLKNSEKKYYKLVNGKDVEWVANIEDATEVETINGEASFKGLEAGTYYLKETKAPEGYNMLTKDVELIILEDKVKETEVIEMKVENNTGVELPGTGGMGTTIFAILGGTVILYAGLSLVKGRMKKERD